MLCIYIDVDIVVFTSNCHNAGAQARLAYLEELMKEIPVSN